MSHDQDAALARNADGDEASFLDGMLWIGVRGRERVLEGADRFSKVHAVLPPVAGCLGWIPLDDHAASIADASSLPKVCASV